MPRNRSRPGPSLQIYGARQPRRRHLQRHGRAWPGRHRPARVEAGDGRQRRAVQEVRRHRRLRYRGGRQGRGRRSATSSKASSRPLAASTWRTSRAPSASSSSERLRSQMQIPVFHDDQHGTAIITGAALLNALEIAARRSISVKRGLRRRGRGGRGVRRAVREARRAAGEHHMCDKFGPRLQRPHRRTWTNGKASSRRALSRARG